MKRGFEYYFQVQKELITGCILKVGTLIWSDEGWINVANLWAILLQDTQTTSGDYIAIRSHVNECDAWPPIRTQITIFGMDFLSVCRQKQKNTSISLNCTILKKK